MAQPIIGFNQGCTKRSSTLEQDLTLAESTGYGVIEIRVDKLQEYLETHKLSDLLSFFGNSRMAPFYLNAIKGFDEPMSAFGNERWRLFCKTAEAAAAIGAPGFVLVPSFSNEEVSVGWDNRLERAAIALARFLKVAASFGLRLAIEPIGSHGYSVRTLEEALEIVQTVNNPLVGLALDTFNLYLDNAGTEWSLTDSSRIFTVHVADAKAGSIETLSQEDRVWPGTGVAPICNMLTKIAAAGYNGPYVLELFNPAYYRIAPSVVHRTGFDLLLKTVNRCLSR